MKSRNADRIEVLPQDEVEPLQEDDLEWLEEFRVALDPDWSVRLENHTLNWLMSSDRGA